MYTHISDSGETSLYIVFSLCIQPYTISLWGFAITFPSYMFQTHNSKGVNLCHQQVFLIVYLVFDFEETRASILASKCIPKAKGHYKRPEILCAQNRIHTYACLNLSDACESHKIGVIFHSSQNICLIRKMRIKK